MNFGLIGLSISALLLISLSFLFYNVYRKSQKRAGLLLKELNEFKESFDAKLADRTRYLEKSRDQMSDYAVQKSEYAFELEAGNNELLNKYNELAGKYEELKALYEQTKAQQENGLSQMRMVVHDLKNPINNILNATDTNENPAHSLIKIRQVSMEMSELVLNILDHGKVEKDTFKAETAWHDLAGSINSVLGKFSPLCREKSIELRTALPEKCGVIADIKLTERIIENLLSNAIRFTQPLGCITLSATPIDDMVRVEVSDNGSGIQRKVLDQVFDEYVHDDSGAFVYSNSTGIGLSFCKKAAEAQGGKIGIISNEGEGTRVWFTLKKGEDIFPGTGQDTNVHIKPEKLNENDICLIKSHVEELSKLNISEISAILKIFRNEVFSSNERIIFWKESIESAVFSGNAELYRKLISVTG